MNRNGPVSVRQCVLVSVDVPCSHCLRNPAAHQLLCVYITVHIFVCLDMLVSLFLQFDEEFSARQEAQAESQKKDERILELEGRIQTLESQVNS